jgi:hypothetical protein
VARRLALVVVLCATTLLTVAWPAEAKSGCGLARAKGSTLVVKTREAVVFKRGFYVYGCLSATGRVHLLPDEGGGIDEAGSDGPQLAGRYVAYSTLGSAIGDEFDRMYVYDLKAGRAFLIVGSNVISAIVLKRNGSAAWIERSPVAPPEGSPDVYQVRKYSHEERQGVVLLDRGADIDPRQLTISEGVTVTWTRGGVIRSASLR